MSEAQLREHARALRATRDGAFVGAAATRQRILMAAYRRKRGRRALLVACTSVATLLVLSTAWAELTGGWPRVFSFVRGAPVPVHHDTVPAPTHLPTPAGPPEAAAPGPSAIDPAPQARNGSLAPSREPSGRRARVTAPAAADTVAGAEESAYEAAHRAHFTERDPAKALLGWDAYLSAYPDGRFALEARYNRALTLVRLGRTEDARAALGPFADGRYGAYRRIEARDLLEAIAGR
jgi:TolA-binding protein